MSIGLLTSLFIFSMTLFCSVLLLTSWMSFIKGANNRDKNNTSDNFKILSQYGFKSKEMKYNKLRI